MANVFIQKSFQILGLMRREKIRDERVFGNKIGLTASLLGCWHDQLTRPFTEGKTSYRSCLKCGARKPFDPETFKTADEFYYPPMIKDHLDT